jgi:hypothetical protein
VAEDEPVTTDKQEWTSQRRVEMRLNVGEPHGRKTRRGVRTLVTLEEMLLEQDKISPWQLQDARSYQERKGGTLAKALVSLGFVEDDEMTLLLSRQYGVPPIDLDPRTVDPAILEAIPEEMARTHKVLPLSRSGATLTVAMADPTNVLAMDDIRLTTGCGVEPVVASESALEDAIDFCYGPEPCAGMRRDAALAEACAKVERTAWQYVTAMHAAAVGGARRPIRGMVEDVEDMRLRLTRERDEAEARVAELERQLAEARRVAATAYEARARPEEWRPPTAGPPRPGRPPWARRG